MQTINGAIYPQILGNTGITLNADRQGRVIEISTQAALQLFQRIAIMEQDLTLNQLGVFSHVHVKPGQPARFASLSTPSHVLSSRKNGCTWNPKGKMKMRVDTFPTCPVEYDGEQCPDAFYGDCVEGIFRPGNGVRDISGSPEGQALLLALLNRVYLGLGNSFSSLYHFANHPLIEDANTNGTYLADPLVWDDYYDQQTSGTCGGLVTALDALKEEGHANLNVQIADSDVDANGNFTGDIIDLLEALIAASSPELKVWIRNGAQTTGLTPLQSQILRPVAGKIYPVILLTEPEYRAYEQYLIQTFNGVPQIWEYFLTGANGNNIIMKNVLRYKGMAVVQWDEIGTFDAIVGTQSHRAAIVAPGAFGLAHDVQDLAQFDGMGLIVQQSSEVQYKGKIFMSTTFHWGAGIVDPTMVTMASNINPA